MDRLPKTISKLLGEDPVLKILIITVVLAIGLFLIYRATRKQEEGFGSFYNEQAPFTRNNQDYYWNNFNRGLIYTDGLQDTVGQIDKATNSVDTQYSTLSLGLNKYFSADPLPGMSVQNQQCAGVTEPSLLPKHDTNTTSACGWWYVDDDNNPSTAARGNEGGAFDTTLPNRFPGGIWIWDLEEAQKKEDIKRCRRIKTCDMIDLSPGKCGFCPPLSTSVPVDSYGRSKYPTDPLYNCGDRPITTPSMCPRPTLPPIVNEDGTLRPAPVPVDICEPLNGRLSLECLIKLATTVGLSEAGAIVSILNGDVNGYAAANRADSSFKYTSANTILLDDCNIAYDPAFIGKGVCDRPTALQYYTRVYNATRTGATTRCREAAGFLAFGTDFDPCSYDNTQVGPFELYCLQRSFREAGCQPDGTMYPKVDNKRAVDSLTWGNVQGLYSQLRADSNSSDYEVQADNALKCLGVTITPKRLDCGDIRGCEVLWYLWENDYNFPGNSATKQTFMGRQTSPTLPNFNESDGSFNPYGRNSTICFRARTNLINPSSARSVSLWVMSDDGIVIKSRGRTLMNIWYGQSPTAHTTSPFVLANGAATPLDIYWYQDYGGATFIPKLSQADGAYDFIPASMLQMSVPSGFPVCRWDFYMGTYNERCSVLTSKPNNLRLGTLANRKCVLFSDVNAGVLINNPVRMGAIRTLTFMVYITAAGAGARLFSFRERAATCADNSDGVSISMEGGLSPNNSLWFRIFHFNTDFARPSFGNMPIILQTQPGSLELNQWVHLTYIIDQSGTAVKMLVNGKTAASAEFSFDGNYYNQLIARDVKIGLGPYKEGCNRESFITGGIAWTHWFDYPFNETQAQQDMEMEFTKSTVYPEDRDSGWVAKY